MTVQERRQKQHKANAEYKAAKRKIRQEAEIYLNELLLKGMQLQLAESLTEDRRKIFIRNWKFRIHHSLGDSQ
jgi:transcription elongation GreA/GreB family factor